MENSKNPCNIDKESPGVELPDSVTIIAGVAETSIITLLIDNANAINSRSMYNSQLHFVAVSVSSMPQKYIQQYDMISLIISNSYGYKQFRGERCFQWSSYHASDLAIKIGRCLERIK